MNHQDAIKYAPEIRLHSDERYFPMHPIDFIRLSRFRHHKGWGSDEGYNKIRKKWYKNNSKASSYYDIPLEVINRFSSHSNGKNRRPRDENNGSSWNVFLQPNGRPRGDRTPNRQVAVYYYIRRRRRMIPFEIYWAITYWFFFGYNDGFLSQNHQGDWEHISLTFDLEKRLKHVYMAAHGSPTRYDKSSVRFIDEHPIVYSAKGSHASYPRPGIYHFGTDHTEDGGYRWQTWLNCQPLKNQPWRNFAGAWGEVGEFSSTTGPLGPWILPKRRRL